MTQVSKFTLINILLFGLICRKLEGSDWRRRRIGQDWARVVVRSLIWGILEETPGNIIYIVIFKKYMQYNLEIILFSIKIKN